MATGSAGVADHVEVAQGEITDLLLLSIAQMPAGVPVGTLAIGEAGAKNAGLLAASIIALRDPKVRRRVELFRKKQTRSVLKQRLS